MNDSGKKCSRKQEDVDWQITTRDTQMGELD